MMPDQAAALAEHVFSAGEWAKFGLEALIIAALLKWGFSQSASRDKQVARLIEAQQNQIASLTELHRSERTEWLEALRRMHGEFMDAYRENTQVLAVLSNRRRRTDPPDEDGQPAYRPDRAAAAGERRGRRG